MMRRSFPTLFFLPFLLVLMAAMSPGNGDRPPEFKSDSGLVKIAKRKRKKPAPVAPAPASISPAKTKRSQNATDRVDFDERLLRGQLNKANAIYLFERRESRPRSLVKKRKNFHREIDEMLE